MAGTLTGREVSGTPLETREGTGALGEDLLRGGRLAAGASFGATGIDPGQLGFGDVAGRLLADPADRLRGLFASLEPFERRQTGEAVAGVREGFGRLGGRFSRGLGEAEARTRGELAGEFARTREQSLIDVQGQQSQTLGMLLQALLGARGQTLGFFQPNAPNFQEGILGDLIGAAGNVAAMGAGR